VLFAGEHGGRFAFEVDVGLATDIDGHAVQGAAGECPRCGARIVAGDGLAGVAADVEALTGEGELAGLGLYLPFADETVAVVQGEGPLRDALGLLAGLVEAGGQELVLADGK